MAGFLRTEAFRKGGQAGDPDVEQISFSRVKSIDTGQVTGANITGNWGDVGVPGNLRVAIACHRSAEGGSPEIDGFGWTKRIERFVGLDNTNDRRAMVIWTKIVGAFGAEQYTTVTWPSSVATRLVLQEINASDYYYVFAGLAFASAATAVGSTGNTAATMAGNTPPLVVPAHRPVYTGTSDKQSLLRMSVMTARAGAVGSNGPAFANVGNLVEFPSAGVFQSALAVGFSPVHTDVVAGEFEETLTWTSDVLQPCLAHLVFGGVASFYPI